MMVLTFVERMPVMNEENENLTDFVARRIKEELKRSKKKQKDILARAGKTYGWIARKVTLKNRRISLQDIEFFAKEFGIPVQAFFYEAEEWYIKEQSIPKLIEYIARNTVKEEIEHSCKYLKDKEKRE